MKCKYKYNGETVGGYESLIRHLQIPENFDDLLFALEHVDEQDKMIRTLTEIQDRNKRRGSSGRYDSEFVKSNDNEDVILEEGSAELKVDESDGFSVQKFIDSGLYIDVEGKPVMPPIRIEDFLKSQLKKYTTSGMSKEEAELKTKKLKQFWKDIAIDCRDLHRIILRMHRDISYSDLDKAVKGTSFEQMQTLLRDGIDNNESIYRQILAQVQFTNGKYSREYGDESNVKLMRNIRLSADLIGHDKKIYANVDFIAVKPDGSLEVFLMKGSHEPPSQWDYAKREKYQHEIALIARMLQHNGLTTKNIRFNIIPVELQYDNDFKSIDDIIVHPAVCYSHKNGAYILQEAYNNASKFISTPTIELDVQTESVDKVNKQLRTFIPDGSLRTFGIVESVKDYIDANWYYWKQGRQPSQGHNLYIGGKKYEISNPAEGSNNEEVVKLITELQSQLIDTESGILSTRGIISQYKDSRRTGTLQFRNLTLDEFFAPYLEKKSEVTINGKKHYEYKWELVENEDITNFNILIFKNTDTDQINVVSLTALDIDKTHKLNRRDNILGYHLDNVNAVDATGKLLLKPTYGNIEMMRLMFLLNELIPNFDHHCKLGDISVIGSLGFNIKSQTYPIEMLQSNFNKIISVLNNVEPSLNIQNNFRTIDTVSPVDSLIQMYLNILQNTSTQISEIRSLKPIITGSNTDGMRILNGDIVSSLVTAETTEVKIERIQELIERLTDIIKSDKHSLAPDDLIKYSKMTTNSKLKMAATLLIEASITLDRLTGNIRIVDSEISQLDKYFARPQNMENSQVRLVGKLLQDAVHATASRMDPEVSEFVNDCMEFYENSGYTSFENFTLGTQSRVFKRLYQDIENQLIFKNPYDRTNDLLEHERKFLKRVIEIIQKINGNDKFPPNISDEQAMNEIEQNNSILWVPLEKASTSTRRTNAWSKPMEYAEELKSRVVNYCQHPDKYFREFYEGILDDEEQVYISQDMRDLQAYNSFRQGQTEKGRKRLNALMQKHGPDYFETNLQNLMIDYIHKYIQEEEMNAMLIKTRGILLYLKLKGMKEIPAEGSSESNKYQELIERIDDYVSVAVYNKSIIHKDWQEWEAKIRPLRKMVTKCYITNNPTGFVRDILGGILSNFNASIFKYRTDVNASDVAWAYQFVLRNSTLSTMNIDLLEKLNMKYLISNINVEQQQEGYKSGTQGIMGDNWKYWSLRKPDYLNRMVLFMAKLKHDGSYKAYYIDNGQLKYNWKLDERFNLIANNDKSDIDAYNKQVSLYLSQIVAYNKENPTKTIPVSLNSDLPEGYTLKQIESVKELANSIYGAYSQSEKAGYEHMFLGQQFAAFSTWMNGIWDVYFGKRRESSHLTEKRQAVNDNGELLYLTDDGQITTEVTDMPFLQDVPVIVQGIMYTLKDIMDIVLFQNNKFGAFKSQILQNKMQLGNLKKVLSHLIIYLIMSMLFKRIIDPAYEKHKKEGDGENFVGNYILELLHDGGSACYEEFKGPFPIFGYVIENTKPAAFQWQQKFARDTWKLMSGDKSAAEYVIGMNALARSMQDSYKMYQRDLVKTPIGNKAEE